MLASFLLFFICFVIIELLYFRIAGRNNIVDKPNHRSSHTTVTIRGGGIIIPIGFLVAFALEFSSDWLYLALGLAAIAAVSFLDDIRTVDSKIRLLVHLGAIALLLWNHLPLAPSLLVAFLFVLFIGIINVYNFMDGINGITGLYSIVTIGTLYWVHLYIQPYMPPVFFVSVLAALTVFAYFNVRKNARCFAGDVGSISIAFIICALLMLVHIATGSIAWIALIGVYGIDGGFTLFCRVVRKENVLTAHRSHFYQFLANEKKLPQVLVSSLYAVIQLIINIVLLLVYDTQPGMIIIILFAFFVIYVTFRIRFEGKNRLFNKY